VSHSESGDSRDIEIVPRHRPDIVSALDRVRVHLEPVSGHWQAVGAWKAAPHCS
jgi:hypothetical protein